MPARKLRLGGASYDLAWASPLAGRVTSDLILVAGGGGSGNTGVKNQVQVVRAKGQGEYELVTQFVTDSDGNQRFCCGICSGGWEGASLVGVALGTHCLVLSMEFDEAQNKATFTRLVEFEADFSEKDAGVNCCCITATSDLVTGGEDGVVRFWRLDKQQHHASATSVSNTFSCPGHSAPVMALGRHPSEPWVCSASKDGSCKMWNSKTGELLADILPVSDGSGNTGAKASLSKMQCRGCCFSADGSHLYTIQCGRIGSTILIMYALVPSKIETGGPGTTSFTAVPKKTAVANKSPSTRLVISGSGKYLAVGCSSGAVSVFHSETFVKVFSGLCHDDQPVLGLAFAPQDDSEPKHNNCVFVTCSVDSFFTSTTVYGSYAPGYLLLAVLLLILGILIHYLHYK